MQRAKTRLCHEWFLNLFAYQNLGDFLRMHKWATCGDYPALSMAGDSSAVLGYFLCEVNS